jgi:hypothetical protein
MEQVFRALAAVEGEPPAGRLGRSFWDRMRGALGV